MKKVKSLNGYTIYQATEKDTKKYNVEEDYFYIYFSSDIRDYGLSNSDWDWEAGTIEEAICFCDNNYAIAKELVEATTTAASFEEIEVIEKKLDNGSSIEEIEEMIEENIIVESVKNELQAIKIPGYIGKWSAFEKCTIENRTFYIMEHDTYGDMTQYNVIECINDKGYLMFLNIFETYDDIITCLMDEEII